MNSELRRSMWAKPWWGSQVKCFLSSTVHLTSHINIVFHPNSPHFRRRPLRLIPHAPEGPRTLLSIQLHLSPVPRDPREHTSAKVCFPIRFTAFRFRLKIVEARETMTNPYNKQCVEAFVFASTPSSVYRWLTQLDYSS